MSLWLMNQMDSAHLPEFASRIITQAIEDPEHAIAYRIVVLSMGLFFLLGGALMALLLTLALMQSQR